MRCIYCLEEKTEDLFSRPEHVLSQAFGRFKNNLTLRNTVCDECNQFFGDNLELELGRDTFEGEARFQHKVKLPGEYRSVGKRSRLIRRFVEGPFKGAYFYLGYSKPLDKVVALPCAQIGFLKRDSGREYFLLDEVPLKLDEEKFNLKHSEGIKILGTDEKTAKVLLKERGIVCKFDRYEDCSIDESSSSSLAEIEYTIDQPIFRAIAKIGFNYLAYWEEPDFVFHEAFDAIREFIRWGKSPDYQLLAIRQGSILADEPVEGKRRLGHLVTVNWARDGISIVSQISLMNLLTYSVILAPDFSGERKSIKRGHFFNLANYEIEELKVKNTGQQVSTGGFN